MDNTTANTAKNPIQLVGSVYTESGKLGDFNWMCQQPEYANTLFIFNDDEETFSTCRGGGGNAIMRKYNKHNKKLTKPKSAGIPTGTRANGGYQKLDSHVITVVTNAIGEIKELLNKYNYETIIYSVGPNGKLGTGIFNVSEDVIDYIDNQIKLLVV